VRNVYDEIQRLDGEVLAITFATPTQLADFAHEVALPFPIVIDVERKAYQAFALGRTNVVGFLRAGVVWHYLQLIFRGWRPKIPTENSDLWQLGGDFVVDRAGRLIFAHASQDATDRPAINDLLTAIRRAGQGK
jgi:peroxiredoxin